MNLDRRFREYVGRSLTRPYNFFSDVRDRRLIPNAQTVVLSFICSGAIGIFLATVLIGFSTHDGVRPYFSAFLPQTIYLPNVGIQWNFGALLVFASAGAFIAVVLMAGVMRFAAIFIRGRYYFADAYNVTVWSLLPFCFLLAYDLIVPRMDFDQSTATLSFLILATMFLWCYFRLLKGTGVLFDIYPTKIYGYGAGFLALVVVIGYAFLQK